MKRARVKAQPVFGKSREKVLRRIKTGKTDKDKEETAKRFLVSTRHWQQFPEQCIGCLHSGGLF